jgi:16S rRNA (guanine966-N2)-methyltransferase
LANDVAFIDVRVVAGELRGRRIESPEGKTTRPTTDMARQAIFNSLGSHYDLTGARIVDCFAGTGALGIEALSRGAGHVTFIERDRVALDYLQRNLTTLGLVDRSTVVRGDALTHVAQCTDATLVLADPPYDFAKWAEFLAVVPCNLVVAESGAPVVAPDGWEVVREKRYGRTHVTFLKRLR